MTSSPVTSYAGWDVAGWTCPNSPRPGKSMDALVVLSLGASGLTVVLAEQANFRRDIVGGVDFVGRRLTSAGLDGARFILAVDAPLGWPDDFGKLLGWTWTVPARSGRKGAHGRLLYRRTDALHKAQSAVSRSIGAGSSKALAYLQAQGFSPTGVGIFQAGDRRAVETYPAAMKRSPGQLNSLHQQLATTLRPRTPDTEDALFCALVAATFGGALPGITLQAPVASISQSEGWIWVP